MKHGGNDHLLSTPDYYDNPDKNLHATLYKGRNLKGSIYKEDDLMNDEEVKYDNEDSVEDEDEDEYSRKNRARMVKKTNDFLLNRKPYYDNEEEDEVDEEEEEGSSNKAHNQEEDLDSLTEKSGSEDNQVYVHTTTSIKQQASHGMEPGRNSAANTLRKNMNGGYGVVKNGYRNVGNGYVAVGGANNHYSTIDPKSLKLIQTKNGLVYTPKTGVMNASRNKSNDALLYNDDEDGVEMAPKQQRHKMTTNDYEGIYDNKTLLTTANNNKNPGGTLRRNAREQDTVASVKAFVDPNENFKMELTQKLKSMSESSSNSQPEPPVRNGSAAGRPNPKASVPVYKPITLAQPEHFSNTTATTSISSAASACTSSSDLAIKEVGYSSASAKSAAVSTTTEINGSNKNYSLLKTTLNGKTDSERPGGGPKPNGAGDTGTLGRGNKPAITKPKPRVETPSSAPSGGKSRPPINAVLLNATTVSVHNQSTDALIKNSKDHASQHTSPSTSVTDVSSTNCTPQHGGGGNSADENGQFIPSSSSTSSANSSTKQISRSRSNSLTRPNPLLKHHNHNHNYHQQHQQQFKTFVQDSQPIYTSNGIYSSNTLSRNKQPPPQTATKPQPAMTTIDDEISMIRNNNRNRTLERRHVKNSEC